MLFKYPSILYAFIGLLIPILVHLLQLRKFRKQSFSNIHFLEQLKIESQSSERIKKILVLLSRLGLISCIIIAFSQPYLPSLQKPPQKMMLYLDNSFSMSAEGKHGALYKRAIQELTEYGIAKQKITLFTNTNTYEDIYFKDIKEKMEGVPLSQQQLSPQQLVLKFKQLSKNTESLQVAMSDFQTHNTRGGYSDLENIQFIRLLPENQENTYIDSVWINVKDNQKILQVSVKNIQSQNSISLTDKEQLISKAQINTDNRDTIIDFHIPINAPIEAILKLDRPSGVKFDDVYYFSTQIPKHIRVVSIGNEDNDFLKRIYHQNEFEYYNFLPNNIDFQTLEQAEHIVLNGVVSLPKFLKNYLRRHLNKGNSLTIIPSKDMDTETLIFFKDELKINYGYLVKKEKKISKIHFEQELLNQVFTKKVLNFNYPKTQYYYPLKEVNKILSYEDNSTFLGQKGQVYVFSSPLNKEICNFKQSPLIVACFYNMAIYNTRITEKSYCIGTPYTINIPIEKRGSEKLITLENKEEKFIPLQKTYQEYIEIETGLLPKYSGNYQILYLEENIGTLSYNHTRTESLLNYENLDNTSVKTYKSIKEFLVSSKSDFEIKELWKSFIIFAVFFFLVEIILLKYLR